MIDHSFKVTLLEYLVPYNIEFYNYINNYSLDNFEYNSNSFFSSSKDDDLKIKINKHIAPILEEHKIILSESWIQKYNEFQFHDMHTHGTGKCLSFVWYIDCTENSSKTIFHNQGYPYIDTHKLIVTPQKNKLILFDGTIPHYVLPNKDKTRLIIGGNLIKPEKFGHQ